MSDKKYEMKNDVICIAARAVISEYVKNNMSPDPNKYFENQDALGRLILGAMEYAYEWGRTSSVVDIEEKVFDLKCDLKSPLSCWLEATEEVG
jgi:hypothetical protein